MTVITKEYNQIIGRRNNITKDIEAYGIKKTIDEWNDCTREIYNTLYLTNLNLINTVLEIESQLNWNQIGD